MVAKNVIEVVTHDVQPPKLKIVLIFSHLLLNNLYLIVINKLIIILILITFSRRLEHVFLG